MNIDPTSASSVQSACSHELNHFVMHNRLDLMHSLVARQKRIAAAPIPDEKLAVYQFMPNHFIAG